MCRYFAVPDLDPCWAALEDPLLAPQLPLLANDLEFSDDCVAEEITIQTSLNLKQTVCPVNPENSESFTKCEREKAGKAKVVDSIPQLKDEASFPFSK
jgi:hypothetical protein